MSRGIVALLGALAGVIVLAVATTDYTHDQSARESARKRASANAESAFEAVAVQRGKAIETECGSPVVGQPMSEVQVACVKNVIALHPMPTRVEPVAPSVSRNSWQRHRPWYMFSLLAVALVTGGLYAAAEGSRKS